MLKVGLVVRKQLLVVDSSERLVAPVPPWAHMDLALVATSAGQFQFFLAMDD